MQKLKSMNQKTQRLPMMKRKSLLMRLLRLWNMDQGYFRNWENKMESQMRIFNRRCTQIITGIMCSKLENHKEKVVVSFSSVMTGNSLSKQCLNLRRTHSWKCFKGTLSILKDTQILYSQEFMVFLL